MSRISCCLAFVLVLLCTLTSGFTSISRSSTLFGSARTTIPTTAIHNAGPPLFSSPEEKEDVSTATATYSQSNDDDEEEEKEGILSKLNSVLDTPILDANNKEDQGPIINALKNFVRDDPEKASVTFSVVVVIFMAAATRGVMFVVNGY